MSVSPFVVTQACLTVIFFFLILRSLRHAFGNGSITESPPLRSAWGWPKVTGIVSQFCLLFVASLAWVIRLTPNGQYALILVAFGAINSLLTSSISKTGTERALYNLASAIVWIIWVLSLARPLFLFTAVPCLLLLSFWADVASSVPINSDQHPYSASDLLSQVTLTWLNHVIKTAASGSLDKSHLWPVDKSLSVRSSFNEGPEPSDTPIPSTLFGLLFYRYPLLLLESTIIGLLEASLNITLPFLLRRLLTHRDYSIVMAWLAAGLTLSVCLSRQLYLLRSIGMRVKSNLTAAVAMKSLNVSQLEDQHGLEPAVLVEVDVTNVTNLIDIFTNIWLIPLQAAFSAGALVIILGWKSVLAGILPAVIVLPTFMRQLRIMIRKMGEVMQAKDKRIKMVTEVLTRIRPIKLYYWQSVFERRIAVLRDAEMNTTLKIARSNALAMFLVVILPPALAAVAFGTRFALGGALTSDTLFPALAFFQLFSRTITTGPQLMLIYSTGAISYDRLRKFLNLPSHKPVNTAATPSSGQPSIHIDNADFYVPTAPPRPLLLGCDISVEKGELIVITGPPGSGKTTLLKAVLREIDPQKGAVIVHGRVSYTSQKPFLINGTIRENITFGLPFDPVWYHRVVEACTLSQDFAALELGDQTRVGGTSAALSGGQCSRVALARAVYARSDVVVLDDPIAAVDAKTQNKIIKGVFGLDGLLKDTVRIATSSTPALNRAADRLYLIAGTQLQNVARSTPAILSPNETISDPATLDDQKLPDQAILFEAPINDPDTVVDETTPILVKPTPAKPAEASEHGVSRQGVLLYLKSARSGGWIIAFAMALLSKTIDVLSVYVLKLLTGASSRAELTVYLVCFSVLGLIAASIMYGLVFAAFYLCAVPISKKIHARLTKGILNAQISFFDTTPGGEILNRFTNDINKIDNPVSGGIIKLITTSTTTIVPLTVLMLMLPPSIIYMIPIVFIYLKVQNYYRHACRQLRRLENEARSPILSCVHEAQAGREVIRVFGQQEAFAQRLSDAVDEHLRVWVPWTFLDSTIQFLSATFLITANAPAGTLGLIMHYTMQITTLLTVLVQTFATLEADMGSIDRLEAFATIPAEGHSSGAKISLPVDWPAEGAIKFDKFSAAHRPGAELCLRGLTVKVPEGSHVAVVGRTGAGKSSLIMALERMLDGVLHQGGSRMEIDGYDTSGMRLKDLRNAFAVIPQELSAFTGTLRDNVDPNNIYSDDEVRSVLRQCGLPELLGLDDLQDPLLHPIENGGASMSAGQMQLLNFARAIILNRKIVLLDEATSAVDADTDLLNRNLMKVHFSKSTVIAIAHKISMLVDFDYVLVMDSGQCVEFDVPKKLLENPDSRFSQLVKESGLSIEDFNELDILLSSALLEKPGKFRPKTHPQGRKSPQGTWNTHAKPNTQAYLKFAIGSQGREFPAGCGGAAESQHMLETNEVRDISGDNFGSVARGERCIMKPGNLELEGCLSAVNHHVGIASTKNCSLPFTAGLPALQKAQIKMHTERARRTQNNASTHLGIPAERLFADTQPALAPQSHAREPESPREVPFTSSSPVFHRYADESHVIGPMQSPDAHLIANYLGLGAGPSLYVQTAVYWRNSLPPGQHCPDLRYMWNQANEALYSELYVSPGISTIIAILLNISGRPLTSMIGNGILLSSAVSLAHSFGLNRDCSSWDIPPAEKRLRTRLWWAIVVYDGWSSVAYGTPPKLNVRQHDVPSPTRASLLGVDEEPAEPDSASVYIGLVTLTEVSDAYLSCVFDLRLPTGRSTHGIVVLDIEARLAQWEDSLPRALKQTISRGVNLHVPGSPNLRLAYLYLRLLIRKLDLDSSKDSPGAVDPAIWTHRHLQARQAAENIVIFVQELDDGSLCDCWLSFNAFALSNTVAFLLRSALETTEHRKNLPESIYVNLAKDMMNALRSHRERMRWDLGNICIAQYGRVLEKLASSDQPMEIIPELEEPLVPDFTEIDDMFPNLWTMFNNG
ncbi:ATP-binding cassette transporter abc3 [Paramyrothecium foliicola]|nr:ATP-binding cassette transporter abc3 [Paramyrothecium foliicola]